jgi:hypothetical protein
MSFRPDPFFFLFFSLQTLLTDGYISQTFQSRAAEQYFLDLLKSTSIPPYATLYNVKRKDYGFFVNSVPLHISALFPDPPDRWLLDRGIVDRGTVVPQTMWSPLSSIDIRRHIERAELQIPVFFEDKDGRVGISLGACIDGQCRVLLRDPTGRAPLGQRSTTHIRIIVSMALCSLWSLFHFEFVTINHHSGPVTKSLSGKSHFATSRGHATPSPWLCLSIVLGDL